VQSGRAQPPPPFDELTPRETEVLGLIASGSKNRASSSRLFISEETVGNHVSNAFRELQVTDRVQAIIRVRDAGMGGKSEEG
jgi:DNA-binding NarL/FixJ family response regulator